MVAECDSGAAELALLRDNLKDVRSTIARWLKQQSTDDGLAAESEESSIANYRDTFNDLKSKVLMTHEKKTQTQEFINGLSGTIENLQKQMISNEEKTARFEEKFTAKEEETAILHQACSNKLQALDKIRQPADEKYDACVTARTTFESQLGLTFNRLNDKVLQLCFQSVDKVHPEREFIVEIEINNNVYSVPRCVPMLDNLDELLQKLNGSNNLGQFVVSVRNSFRQLCQQ